MIDSPILSDVTFLVENKEIKASKLLLASRSDHFRALFFGGLKETNNCNEAININGITYDVFIKILEFL